MKEQASGFETGLGYILSGVKRQKWDFIYQAEGICIMKAKQ
jgi:hypothetical protein